MSEAKKPRKKTREPEWKPTEEDLQNIQTWAGQGVPEYTIAEQYGYTSTHWPVVKKRYPEVADAIKKGKRKTVIMASGKLYDIWSNPEHPKQLPALLFFLKTKCGFVENSQQEVQPPKYIDFEKDEE